MYLNYKNSYLLFINFVFKKLYSVFILNFHKVYFVDVGILRNSRILRRAGQVIRKGTVTGGIWDGKLVCINNFAKP